MHEESRSRVIAATATAAKDKSAGQLNYSCKKNHSGGQDPSLSLSLTLSHSLSLSYFLSIYLLHTISLFTTLSLIPMLHMYIGILHKQTQAFILPIY